jgi:hypothetical protein
MFMRPLVVVALAFAGSACSGTTSTVAPTDGGAKTDGSQDKDSGTKPDAAQDSSSPPTNAEACMDRATAQCALIEKCRPVSIETNYGTLAACVSGLQENCENSLSAKGNGNDAVFTEACAQAIPTWSCEDFANNVNPPTACAQKTGTLKANAACAFPGQCESGFCAISANAQCGTCKDPPAKGDSCADLTTCGTGFVCAAVVQTCTPFVAKGGKCGSGAPCGYELSGVGVDAKAGIQGTCQESVLKEGAACDATLKTGPSCDIGAGLTCNTSSLTCEKASIALTGKPCGKVNDQEALCAAGGTCTAATGMAGTCIAAAKEGEACDENGGTGCVSPERCVGFSVGGGSSGKCQFASADTCK